MRTLEYVGRRVEAAPCSVVRVASSHRFTLVVSLGRGLLDPHRHPPQHTFVALFPSSTTRLIVDDPSSACGHYSDCINRAIFIECLAKECRTGKHCLNQRYVHDSYACADGAG